MKFMLLFTFYDILDDLEKIGSDSKETVVANDSDGFDFDIIITVCPYYTANNTRIYTSFCSALLLNVFATHILHKKFTE